MYNEDDHVIFDDNGTQRSGSILSIEGIRYRITVDGMDKISYVTHNQIIGLKDSASANKYPWL